MTDDQRSRELDAQIRRSEHARHILDDPLVAETLNRLEAAAIDRWKGSAGGDIAGRERAYLEFRMARAFRGALAEVMNTGKIAGAELTALQKLRRTMFN